MIVPGFTAAFGLSAPTDPAGGRTPTATAIKGAGLKNSRTRCARANALKLPFRPVVSPDWQNDGVALGTISLPVVVFWKVLDQILLCQVIGQGIPILPLRALKVAVGIVDQSKMLLTSSLLGNTPRIGRDLQPAHHMLAVACSPDYCPD